MKELQVPEYLHDIIKKAKGKLVNIFSSSIACGTVALLTTTAWPVFVGFSVFFVGLLVTQGTNWASLQNDIRGEQITRGCLKAAGLPDQYTAYYNLPIHHAALDVEGMKRVKVLKP
jgi:hypothetical protein